MRKQSIALGIGVLGIVGAILLAGCDSTTNPDPPNPYNPITESVNLTPSWDSGSPIILESDADSLTLAFTSTYGGSGDIYLLKVADSDSDGIFESFPESLYVNTLADSIWGPRAKRFSRIGQYEFEDSNGVWFPNYPGSAYYAGPRHLNYDMYSGRIFYSMGYNGIPQVASTTAPMFGEFDQSLNELYDIDTGREPIWDFWYSKLEVPDPTDPGETMYTFTGAYYASVAAPNSFGDQWMAYSDTLIVSGDQDFDGEMGEDPVGAIETYSGLDDDGAPGIEGDDDDGDGFEDEFDFQVQAMSTPGPEAGSYAWKMQNYDPISDDDEDGLMDEDPDDDIDNDGDGRTDEDHEGDMNNDGSPGWATGDVDGDGLSGFEDLEVRHAALRVERFLANGYDPAADDDEDGIHDEDADYKRDGIWVVKIGADGLPDEAQVPITLTNDGGRQPFFNPVNEEELLYVSNGNIKRLNLTYEAASVSVSTTDMITDNGWLESYPAYSDDGTKIVYVSSEKGSADLWTMDSDGAGNVRVTNDPGQELLPRFTPGGDQIVFEAWRFPEGDRRVLITIETLP